MTGSTDKHEALRLHRLDDALKAAVPYGEARVRQAFVQQRGTASDDALLQTALAAARELEARQPSTNPRVELLPRNDERWLHLGLASMRVDPEAENDAQVYLLEFDPLSSSEPESTYIEGTIRVDGCELKDHEVLSAPPRGGFVQVRGRTERPISGLPYQRPPGHRTLG